MSKRTWKWAVWVALAVGVPGSARAAQRVAVVTVTDKAGPMAARLVSALQARPDMGEVIAPAKAGPWFALCFDDKTDACILQVMLHRKIDAVLRVWVGSDGKLLAVDSIRSGQSAPGSYQADKLDERTPAQLQQVASDAVEKLFGPAPAPTPPIVAAPETASPAGATPSPQIALAPEVAQPSSGTSGLRVASYVTAAVGAAGLVLGVVEAVNVNALNKDIQQDITNGNPVDAHYQSAKTSALVANVAFIAGGAALAAGVVMFILSPSESPKTVASVAVIDGRPAVAISGHF